MLKKILLASIFVITAITNVTHAEDDMKTVASKAYVDTKIETKQLKIPAAGQPNVDAGETVMTYTATGNGQIGERGLYSDISSYDASTDGDKLITASALNATFTNLPTTDTTKLECANLNDGCTLWTIVDQTAYTFQLPDGYTRLQYIESTGTQYIETGFTFETSTKIEFTIERLGTNAGYGADHSRGNVWFGANGSTGTENLLGWGSNGNINYFRGTAGSSFYSLPLNTKTNIIFDYTKGAIKLFANGVQQGNTGTSTSSIDKRVLLGGVVDNAPPGVLYCLERFYDGVKIWNGDILVANFIPAKRNSDNVLGMYDLVSGQFFTNQGTGNFVGPPAN